MVPFHSHLQLLPPVLLLPKSSAVDGGAADVVVGVSYPRVNQISVLWVVFVEVEVEAVAEEVLHAAAAVEGVGGDGMLSSLDCSGYSGCSVLHYSY